MPLCRIIYRQFALIGRFCHKFLIQAIPAGADIRSCEISKSACLRSQIAVFHAAADVNQFIVRPVRKLKPKTGHISSGAAIIYRLIFERQTFQPLVQRFDIIFFCNDFLLCLYRNALEMIHYSTFHIIGCKRQVQLDRFSTAADRSVHDSGLHGIHAQV